MNHLPARLIALYLPQFHAIPENDTWWGKGFTEWVNVRKARPRFAGHAQPHVPGVLGYYNLLEPDVRAAQAALARAHGIEAFCYYHYWFNGKLLLEQPLEAVLESGQPDFGFCLCWANENWSRRWDGKDREVLIAQDYAAYDARQHAAYLSRAFLDPRYVRVNGKPLFVIYRHDHIPNLAGLLASLRAALAERGVPEVFWCAMSRGSQLDQDAINAGLDRLVNFQPAEDVPAQGVSLEHLGQVLGKLGSGYVRPQITSYLPRLEFDLVFDYAQVVARQMRQTLPRTVLPCVFPSWDNSSRRRSGAVIIENHDPEPYARWLEHTIRSLVDRPEPERIVFINAWNEWAEGCHLEPDARHGDAFLQATKTALERAM